jgi:hypothetical protein
MAFTVEQTEILKRAREEILDLRSQNDRQSIRLTAIDDFLCVLHGTPGRKNGEGLMSHDIVAEIDRALAGPKPATPGVGKNDEIHGHGRRDD